MYVGVAMCVCVRVCAVYWQQRASHVKQLAAAVGSRRRAKNLPQCGMDAARCTTLWALISGCQKVMPPLTAATLPPNTTDNLLPS